ncbi:STY0301 family protein [Paracidovorax avenae]|uniref:STY0301 family protein n=1 Tax=Paracidovorax avenae TaxID=80867 RepID=UPI001F15B95C|nr:STY0301 family protein [Paracidovorax avenae]
MEYRGNLMNLLNARAFYALLAAASITLPGASVQAARPVNADQNAAPAMQCPAQLQVQQTAESVAETGWQVEGTRKNHPLVTISFFAGPPEQKAQLVPTRESRKGKSPTATWELERRDQPYWVACEYGATSAIATRALPVEVTACTVEYDPNFSEPVMKRWSCRSGK